MEVISLRLLAIFYRNYNHDSLLHTKNEKIKKIVPQKNCKLMFSNWVKRQRYNFWYKLIIALLKCDKFILGKEKLRLILLRKFKLSHSARQTTS